MNAARYLSVREYAATYGVSAATVYAMVAAGKLPHVRLGAGRGTIHIPADAVLKTVLPKEETMPSPTVTPAPRKSAFKHLLL